MNNASGFNDESAIDPGEVKVPGDGAEIRSDASQTSVDRDRRNADQNPLCIGHCDVNSRYLFVNKAFADLFDRKPSQLIGMTVAEVMGGSGDVGLARQIGAVLRGEAVTFKTEISSLTGPVRSVCCSCLPERDENGGVGGFSIVIHQDSEKNSPDAGLVESEYHYRNLVELNPQIPWTADADGRITDFSARWLEVTGMTREEALNDGWQKVQHPDDLLRMQAAWARSLKTEQPYDFEHRVRLVDGSFKWMRSRATARRDAGGRIVRWYGSTEDIHAQKKAEQSLLESEERFRLMANSIPQLAWMAHGDGFLFWYNQRWYDYTGTNFEEMQGWGWERVHDPEALPRVIENWTAAHASKTPWEDIFPLRRHDGQMRRHLSRAMPLLNENGEVTLWFGTNTDIEEQLRNDQALAEARQRLALSIESAEIGTFYCPMPLGEIEWNAKCKDHFWLPPDARIDFDLFYSIIHSEDRERVRLAVERAVYHRQPYDVEYRTVAPDGRIRWLRAKGRAFYDEAGQPLRFDGVTIDISDQKRVEDTRTKLLEAERATRADAERTSRLKDEFLATLSHELRTPLNAILGWSQLLRGYNKGDTEIAEGLSVIERNARVQVQLVEDLLDMSRIISGKLRMDVQRVDLSEIIRSAVDSVHPAADAKEIRIQLVLDTHIGPVRGDPSRLQQVVWNLLNNAIKFTPKRGKVQVALERVNSHVEMTVTDTGAGISPDFLPHLFERFRQADGTTTRKHGGLGLGLAIVKSIVEAHGGQVRAKSPGDGLGATLIVELPLVVVTESGDEQVRQHPLRQTSELELIAPMREEGLLKGMCILVVDDEADAREIVRRLLESCHGKVLIAADASEAIELLQKERPDALVSDIGMPGEDGYALIRRVRELSEDKGGRTPAAALTAFARSDDRRRALLAGYQSHISKPVEPAELVTVVASLCGKFGAQK